MSEQQAEELANEINNFEELVEMPEVNGSPSPDFCPYEKQQCMCWDQECQASQCILEDEQEKKAEYKRGHEDGEAQSQIPQQDLIDSAKKIQEEVKQFEKASGITIGQYTGGQGLGEAVQIVRDATRIGTHIGDLKNTERTHRRIADAAKSAAEKLQKLIKQKSV